MILSNYEVLSILSNSIFIFIWTWILNYLCKSGYTGISWFLVIFPYIFIAIILIGFFSSIKGKFTVNDYNTLIKEAKNNK